MVLDWKRIEPGEGHAAGRALLEALYLRSTGRPMPPIATAPGGKPYFPGGDLHFSISHTPRHVFCVLSDRPVGIDAEEYDRTVNPALAEKILSPAEAERFSRADDPRAALLRLWVLKEARVKASGEGLRGWPNNTDFSPDDPRVTVIDGCYVAVLHHSGER